MVVPPRTPARRKFLEELLTGGHSHNDGILFGLDPWMADDRKQPVQFKDAIPKAFDLGLICGQERTKRGAIISAVGGNNRLLIGPPRERTSLFASAISCILPRLSDGEKAQFTPNLLGLRAARKRWIGSNSPVQANRPSQRTKQSLWSQRSSEITFSKLEAPFLNGTATLSAETETGQSWASHGNR